MPAQVCAGILPAQFFARERLKKYRAHVVWANGIAVGTNVDVR
jgi:hypothetical protein